MFEFAGDVSRKDVRLALQDVLEEEHGLISRAEDNGMALNIEIDRDFTPTLRLKYTNSEDISARFDAVEIVDDYDTVVGCYFEPVINNIGKSDQNAVAAENRFYRWYQFATVAKEIASVKFYPFDYFD